MIGIINYGMGNLSSVINAFLHLGAEVKIVESPEEIAACEKIVLPGVGAFGMAIQNINRLNFPDSIKKHAIIQKKPLLGICLGMQLLFDKSYEQGVYEGLGLIKGEVLPFREKLIDKMPVPHMGWNDVIPSEKSVLFKNVGTASYYFVHSYYCLADDNTQVAGKTEYGFSFHAAVEKENIYGCQFHPEKSQVSGLTLFKNFINL
jgi:glutamine amidotransferase